MQMKHSNANNAEMVKHIAAVEGHTALLREQLQQTGLHWNRALADNACLHQQLAVLTARTEVLELFCYGPHHACSSLAAACQQYLLSLQAQSDNEVCPALQSS